MLIGWSIIFVMAVLPKVLFAVGVVAVIYFAMRYAPNNWVRTAVVVVPSLALSYHFLVPSSIAFCRQVDAVDRMDVGNHAAFAHASDDSWWTIGQNYGGRQEKVGLNKLETFRKVEGIDGARMVVISPWMRYAQMPDGRWMVSGPLLNSYEKLNNDQSSLRFRHDASLDDVESIITDGGYYIFFKHKSNEWRLLARVPILRDFDRGFMYDLLSATQTITTSTPIPVPALSGATDVVIGRATLIARMSDGRWYGIGTNHDNALGLKGVERLNRLTHMPALDGVEKIYADKRAFYARKPDGSWLILIYTGRHLYGMRTETIEFTPAPVLQGAKEVWQSAGFDIARLPDGRWVVSGLRSVGTTFKKFENAIRVSEDDPFNFHHLPALDGVTKVAVGSSRFYAMTSDGKWHTFNDEKLKPICEGF